MESYSKNIDEESMKQAEIDTEPLPDKDYLDVDKVKESQTHYCISFLPPQFSRTEQVETLLFSYFLAEKQSISGLYDLVKSAKDSLEPANQETEDDPLQIEKKRIEESFYTNLIKTYQGYKKDNKVYLDNKLVEYFGDDIEKQPLQGALKVRGVFKNSTKAMTKAKEFSKSDGFTVFIGETGKWMPFNPDKYRIDNYKTTNKEFNELMKSTLQEREKSEKAFGLRTELFKRQGKKIAEDIKNKNLEDIKKGMFDGPDHFLQRKLPIEDIRLTKIDDWSKDPNETAEAKEGEVNMLPDKHGPKPSIKNIPEKSVVI